jgi:hypothetical protein
MAKTEYSSEEDKELNKTLKKYQSRAKRLILGDYYDHVRLSELQYDILKSVTNAETHNDINWYLWNTGMIPQILDYIQTEITRLRKQDR